MQKFAFREIAVPSDCARAPVLCGTGLRGQRIPAAQLEFPERSEIERARFMRFSMAAGLLTNALEISFTLKPHRMWRIRATCASSDNWGWQQENIMRNKSSLIALS